MEVLFQNWINAAYIILQFFILTYNLGKLSMTLTIILIMAFGIKKKKLKIVMPCFLDQK